MTHDFFRHTGDTIPALGSKKGLKKSSFFALFDTQNATPFWQVPARVFDSLIKEFRCKKNSSPLFFPDSSTQLMVSKTVALMACSLKLSFLTLNFLPYEHH